MASSSAKIYAPYGNGKTYYYTISINTEEKALSDTNKTNNTSDIKLTGKIKADGQIAFDGSSVHTLGVYWYDNNKNTAGKLVASKTMKTLNIDAEISVETTISVDHLADGTLKGYAQVVFTKSGSNSYVPASGSTKTQEAALITVPRATSISNYTATIGTQVKFEWTKASPSFTHKLTYTIGSVSETIGENLVDYKEWTPPDKLYQQFPNAPSIDGTLYLTTYNGTTQIGETKSSKLTIKADKTKSDAVVEEFSIRDENTKTSTLTGDKTTLVLTKSTAFVTLVFKTRKYAKVKSVTINGKAVEVQAGTTSNGETNYGVQTSIGVATTGNFDLKITDTRDFPKETSTRNSVVDYIPLTATALFKRIAPTTGKVGLTFEGNYFGQSFGDKPNTLTISYKYKKTNESNYSNEIILVENTHYKTTTTKYYSGTGSSKQTLELAPTFDYKSAYNLTFDVKDELTTYPTIYVTVVKGIPIVWWNGNKFVVCGALNIANSEGAVQTTINNGAISTNGNMNIKADGANISYQQGGLPILRNNGTDSTLLAGNGNIYLRPNGHTNSSGETKITSNGNMSVSGTITSGGTQVAKKTDLASTITKCTLSNVSVTTGASATVLTQTISTAGTYLLMGYSNLNRYNQNGRELHVKLQKNGTDFWDYLDVGDYGWTVAVTISAVQTFAKNDVLKVVITNPGGKQWAHGVSYLWLVKLPG